MTAVAAAQEKKEKHEKSLLAIQNKAQQQVTQGEARCAAASVSV